MSERNKVVPDSMLSKEFLSQFKTEADVSKFLKQLHSQVLEKMLEGEMDVHPWFPEHQSRISGCDVVSCQPTGKGVTVSN